MMGDVSVSLHGKLVLLCPQTPAGHEWVDQHLSGALRWGIEVVVEPRYLAPLVESMREDGLDVRREA